MTHSRGSGHEPPTPPRPGPYGPNGPYEFTGTPSTSGAHRAVNPQLNTGSGAHRRSGRRKRSNAGKIGLAGALAGVLGIGVVAAMIVIFRHDGSTTAQTGSSTQPAGGVQQIAAPKTGAPLSLATPDGFSYSLGAIQAGTTSQALTKGGTPAPGGAVYAYARYILTNTGKQPALIDLAAADLFVKKDKVSDAAQARCMPQPGTPDDMCTLPNSGAVIGIVNGSKPPTTQAGGDQYLAPGSSMEIQIQTSLTVAPDTTQADMGVYVWAPRYIVNRQAVKAAFP